ncbi:hypothetical protein EZS27_004468 [termite gut metagenome]|uniref:Uncharacterized protein n=1 Tax=termite gut metagenome TaxID=433724 RepID=A0A5J4SPE6_9ZZZZ
MPYAGWNDDGGISRLKYYWICTDWFDRRKTWRKILKILIYLQCKLGINRKFNFFEGNIWGGETYWSLSNRGIEIILNYIANNPDYLKRFKFTTIAEEIMIHSILLNQTESKLINDSLRYIQWLPVLKTLTEEDYEKIVNSNSFFARKFDKTKSQKLVQLLNNYIG